MAITVVQRVASIATSNSAGAFAATIAEPAADNLIVAVGASRDSASGLTIGGITGWTLLDSELNIGTDGMSIQMWYRIAAAGLGTSVSVTPGASSKPGIYFVEASSDVGWDFAGNPPKFASANGSGTAGSTGTTLTTAVAAALGIGAIVGEGNVAGFTSWLNSFTERADLDATSASGNRIFLGAADLIISTIGTKSTGATLGASVPWAGVIGVFEEAAPASDPIDLDHLDASPTFHTAELASAIHLAHLDASPTFHTGELAGAIALTHLDASPTFHTLEVEAVAENAISLTHLDASPTFHTGELASAVHLDHLDASPTFHTLVIGATTIDLDHLDASPTFHTLVVAGSVTHHPPGRTAIDINPSSTWVDVNPSLNTVEIDRSRTFADIDEDPTTEA